MAPLKSGLSADGIRVLNLLMNRYGMTESNALQLMKDGGPALALALMVLAR